MFVKLLLTLAVILTAYGVLRARFAATSGSQAESAWPSWRGIAYGLVGLIVLASAGSAIHQWQRARQVIEIQVVNPATGAIDHYQARRGDIQGRGFRTLEGQQVRIAEFERMILSDAR